MCLTLLLGAQTAGTWFSGSFQVFVSTARPRLFDVLGLYCIPHCGVYGEDYTPCGPAGVIGASLPDIRLGRWARRGLFATLTEPVT